MTTIFDNTINELLEFHFPDYSESDDEEINHEIRYTEWKLGDEDPSFTVYEITRCN